MGAYRGEIFEGGAKAGAEIVFLGVRAMVALVSVDFCRPWLTGQFFSCR